MKGVKNFIIGFSLSLVSVSMAGQLYSSAAFPSKKHPTLPNVHIDLFKIKNSDAKLSQNVTANIKKKVTVTNAEFSGFKQNHKKTNVSFEKENVLLSSSSDGIDDDEILSINQDSGIPIEYIISTDAGTANFANNEPDDKVAMLPEDTQADSLSFEDSSPWVIAKGIKHTRNKLFGENFLQQEDLDTLPRLSEQGALSDENISYKIAERVKQNIIFPIPDEILNDENLTPTFIKNPKQATQKSTASTAVKKTSAKKTAKKELEVLPKTPVKEATSPDSNSFLNSISSWFSDKTTSSEPSKSKQKSKAAPLYSSQNAVAAKESAPAQQQKANSSNDDFISFYETLQETKEEYNRKGAVPTELKLQFQPGRAEISGTTLNWLKTFSEAALRDDTYLQVRLDASASTELQRRRLNLLYTIFMNNGVDFKKIDTLFSSTEPNSFIIKVLKFKKSPNSKDIKK